jgi:hypothetical protein
MPTLSAFYSCTNISSNYLQLGYTNFCKVTTALITCLPFTNLLGRHKQQILCLSIFQLQYKSPVPLTSPLRARPLFWRNATLLYYSTPKLRLRAFQRSRFTAKLRLKVQVSIYWTAFRTEDINPSKGKIWCSRVSWKSLRSQCEQSAV